jgi:hypothetical protein
MGDVPGTDVWTKGVTTSAVDTGALLGSSQGNALFNAAYGALGKYWVLEPHGTETAEQLKTRIALVFAQRVASSWAGSVSVDDVNNSPAFDAIVADVSLTSRRKTAQELAHDAHVRMIWWGVGLAAVGVIGLLIYRSRKNKGAASVPADAEWGQGEFA